VNPEHPTILAFRAREQAVSETPVIDRDLLIQIARECGAEDAGVVNLDRPELDEDRPFIVRAFPRTRTLLAIVVGMNPVSVRSPARSLANLEFHAATDEADDVGRAIVARLKERGIAAMNTAPGFPMEMSDFPGRGWIVAHKRVAEAAGLGKMGIHRNVIHPKLGNFILLNTVLVEAEVPSQSVPIDFNPCLECKLCVAACPVGAVGGDGHFDAIACLNHNYREFLGGFIDWVKTVADSPSGRAYRVKISDQETASMWQSLSFGANYKAAYCMAVCPAGEDIIAPFLTNRAGFVKEVLRPLQDKEEPVYVVPGSDAEAHVLKRFPHKTVRRIRGGVAPPTVARLIKTMPLAFQRGRSEGVDARYHFHFTGSEEIEVTFVIRDQKFQVLPGLEGKPDLTVTADATAWLEFLRRERKLAVMLATGNLRIKGDPRLLLKFGRCFPG